MHLRRTVASIQKHFSQYRMQKRLTYQKTLVQNGNKKGVLKKECTSDPSLPKLLVISGPSAVGKSTLLSLIIQDFPERFEVCVSHTTRRPRPGEKHGIHYYFLTAREMRDGIKQGLYLQTVEYAGFMYGTNRAAIDKIARNGKICLMDINVDGVRHMKTYQNYCVWYVFLLPPTVARLEERLRNRRTETEKSMKARLKVVASEIQYGLKQGNFDKIIINDNLHHAYVQLRKFVVNNILIQFWEPPLVTGSKCREKT